MPTRQGGKAVKTPAPGAVGAVSGRRPFRPRRSREPGTRSWRYPSRSSKFACGGLPDVIRSQRSPYDTSLLGAGAVHHIKLCLAGVPCALLRSVEAELLDQRSPLLLLGLDVAADAVRRRRVEREETDIRGALLHIGRRHDAPHLLVQRSMISCGVAAGASRICHD